MNARIVRKVVGDGLVPVPQVPRAVRRVHDFHGGGPAALGRPVLGRQGKGLLELGDELAELFEPGALAFVADEHGRAVGSLDAEEIVQVRLVRRQDEIELRVLELDPGDVARIVVVG